MQAVCSAHFIAVRRGDGRPAKGFYKYFEPRFKVDLRRAERSPPMR